jgi:ATP-dependent DNA helicase RecG
MPTTAADFQRYLDAPEGDRLEFKSATGGFHFDKLTKYCVALANEGGGKIILGVTDRRPRSVVGTHAFEEPGRTEAGLYQRLHCRIEVEEFHHAGQRVLIVHVPSRPTGLALQYEGTYWMRAGDDLLPMSAERLREIFLEAGPDFSAEPSRATLADLNPAAIAEFRRRWAARGETARIQSWSDAELLRNAELQEGDAVLNAALVLFGTHAALGRHLAQAEIVFEYRSSEASGPAADRAEFREGFFLFHDALWQRINLRNDRQTIQEGFFLTEIPTFEERPIREAVLNAISHRDYRDGGSVFVRQYARRLEIISPGGFPPGISAETILDQQYPRNRRLAEALARCGLIERSGQGMNIMFEQSIRHSKPVPDFAGTTAREVHLTLHGTVTHPAFVRFLEKVGAERLATFSTHDFLVLDALQRGQPILADWRPALDRLVESGLVETLGRGRGTRHILSRSLYAELGSRGTYTRKRGLDHETNKELLLKHLRDITPKGCALAELSQVLPSLSESAVQRLLSELREAGRVELRGKRRWARWFLVDAKAQPPASKAHDPL